MKEIKLTDGPLELIMVSSKILVSNYILRQKRVDKSDILFVFVCK